jgi:hypothetical protein
MRKTILLAATAALAAAVVAASSMTTASAQTDADPSALTLAVYGDAPYGTAPADTAQFLAMPGFIDSINADPDVSTVVHVGDIHSGKQYCTESYDTSVADLFAHYQDSLVYTPGDNEWTDCHKAAEGGGKYNTTTGQIDYVLDPVAHTPIDYASGDPVANLDLVRSTFFNRPGWTLGGGDLHVQTQARDFDPAHPSDANYVENVMWQRKGVLFVTLNIPGGSNNDTDPWYGAPAMSPVQSQEVAERTGADLRWLDHAFTVAQTGNAQAIMIISQADMWELDGKPVSHLTQYEPFVAALAARTTAFGKPVLLFNGDSHTYRSDNPLSPSAPCVIEAAGGTETSCVSAASAHPGYDVANFHRIVVHGSTFPMEWLKLTILPGNNTASGPNTFGPFSWQRMPQP